jgi:hypothetical protein
MASIARFIRCLISYRNTFSSDCRRNVGEREKESILDGEREDVSRASDIIWVDPPLMVDVEL